MKRRIKKGPVIIAILIILTLIGASFAIYKNIQYKNSNTYKLLQLGYKENEVKAMETKLKDVDKIVQSKYNVKIPKLLAEKYFMEKNLDRYLDFSEKNIQTDLKDVVPLVNVHADKEDYTDFLQTDTSKKEAMIVNKHYTLTESFAPTKVVDISTKYAYANNQISSEIYDIYKEMCDAASGASTDTTKVSIKLVATSGYRGYADQKKVYDNYVKKGGQKYADDYAAKPGFSEHQTGLTIDIMSVGTTKETFEASDAFAWLQEHAAEYGFILRYPKGKEALTGYAYEPWHYRYVGKELALKIKKEGITFDEYYAYYLEDK